jgi:hypothetical protein
MKPFRFLTEVAITPPAWKITHQWGILTVGSCFSEVLGRQLQDHKFSVLNDVFGTVFNPLTLAKLLDMAVDRKSPEPSLYFQNGDGVWLHHDFHSSHWGRDRKTFESSLLQKLSEVRSFLRDANLLVITLGSAYAYRHRATNLTIGNCHKQPSDRFLKELLNQDQIMICLEQIFFKLIAFNRNLRIVLTVSPVRHTRDTLVLNQVSKSTLRLVSHKLSEKFKQVEYFPSYELMVDELRDYRFYEEDLIHPSKVAEDYIFQKFVNSFVEPASVGLMQEWHGIRQMMQHKTQHGATKSHLQFLKSIEQKLSGITSQMDVSAELAEIKRKIEEYRGEQQTH